MITVTEQAAEQIRIAARQGGAEGMALRFAGKRNPDGSIAYGMGFDEPGEDDIQLTSNGIGIVVSPANVELLNGMVVDYVELKPGEFRFIFMNPNDPTYRPPAEGSSAPAPRSGPDAGDGGS
jgi:iron-sulfur cluster assembly protein